MSRTLEHPTHKISDDPVLAPKQSGPAEVFLGETPTEIEDYRILVTEDRRDEKAIWRAVLT